MGQRFPYRGFPKRLFPQGTQSLDAPLDAQAGHGLAAVLIHQRAQAHSHRHRRQSTRTQPRDHGAGAPDYALAQLFNRFYSLPRPATGKKSTGLGLALVREVARLHGGEAGFANHPEGGGEARLVLGRG